MYFITKKDFSSKQVASVLLHLNLLSCALPYIIDTAYVFYYYPPLISFWFLIVYATFAIGPKYNDNMRVLPLKPSIAAFICPRVIIWLPLLEWTFVILGVIFRVNWNLHKWQFRLGLDGFIVYISVLIGGALVKTKLYSNILAQTGNAAGILSGVSIMAYLHSSSTLFDRKQLHTSLHPFISFIPIIGSIALQNINPDDRVWSWRSMA
ncbi:Cas1p 10 TM acyl transferase domain-containing protein [Thelonectria olida]|uniref:Cas1p 10 TM acyl transferase domain-containing protein n=1 Tax=Thelonectria olida TaxID=1576542 RepID=A0A9P8W9J3_9HYPO|nr:Cas1p 10 TM acyl transferase domain-containing protein [Thelonectria olida]